MMAELEANREINSKRQLSNWDC